MTATKLWTEAALKLHTLTAQVGGAVNIQGIVSQVLNQNLRTRTERADGDTYATFGSLVGGAPTAQLTTVDLVAFLDACGVTGMKVDSDGTHPGVVMYFTRKAAGGTNVADATATHWSATIEDGLLIPTGLSLPHGDVARLSASLVAVKPGSTAPVQFSETAALPTLSEDLTATYTLGKVDLNGTQLEGVKSVAIDFGIRAIVEGADGDIYPSIVSVRLIQPRITITCQHIDFTATATEDGLYYASGVVLYARKRDEGGTYVADGTAEHVSFTLGKCRLDTGPISGDPKTITFTLTPWNTGGGAAPITIDTTAAIV